MIFFLQNASDPHDHNVVSNNLPDHAEDAHKQDSTSDVPFSNVVVPSNANQHITCPVPIQMVPHVVSIPDTVITESQVSLPDHLLSSLNSEISIVLH